MAETDLSTSIQQQFFWGLFFRMPSISCDIPFIVTFAFAFELSMIQIVAVRSSGKVYR